MVNYNEHVVIVQHLSKDSSWRLRYENAREYLQGGNILIVIINN